MFTEFSGPPGDLFFFFLYLSPALYSAYGVLCRTLVLGKREASGSGELDGSPRESFRLRPQSVKHLIHLLRLQKLVLVGLWYLYTLCRSVGVSGHLCCISPRLFEKIDLTQSI